MRGLITLADSTLMSMTKKEIIEQLRTAEHNFKAMEETYGKVNGENGAD